MRQIQRIAHHVDEPPIEEFNPEVWAVTWPEVGVKDYHGRDPIWRTLYLSFHRAAFWQVLAEEIGGLYRHHHRVTNPDLGDAGPSPTTWAVRAVPEGLHGQVAAFLGDIDRWVETLYPKGSGGIDLSAWTWESDQLVAAVLATVNRTTLAQAIRKCEPPGYALKVPVDVLGPSLKKTRAILKSFRRLLPSANIDHQLGVATLAHLYCGRRDTGLGEVLFPRRNKPGVDRVHGTSDIVTLAINLGCSASIPTRLLMPLVSEPSDFVRAIQTDSLKLNEYGRAHRILMSRKDALQEWKSSKPTLHRLLWGPVQSGKSMAAWRPRPWEIPAVGLTVTFATQLFRTIQMHAPTVECNPAKGPFTWRIRGGLKLISKGRRIQLGIKCDGSVPKRSKPRAERSLAWEVPPHPAYFLPFLTGTPAREVDCASYALYCDVLLLLTALDGGEAILHNLAKTGGGIVPFVDRWAWRSRIHLPMEAWKQIERVMRWAERSSDSVSPLADTLNDSLWNQEHPSLKLEHYYLERVDIRLNPKQDTEVVRTVRTQGSVDSILPVDLQLDLDALANKLVVRICQVAQWPATKDVIKRFPALASSTAQRIMEDVATAFQSPSRAGGGRKPDLVLLPEVSIPVPEVRTIRKLVEMEGLASLAGYFWRELRPVYPTAGRPSRERRWFVNEAELVIPFGFDGRGPTSSRWFRVRKPVPAHIEAGLARSLSKNTRAKMAYSRGSALVPVSSYGMGRFYDRSLCRLAGCCTMAIPARRIAASVHGGIQQRCRSIRVLDVGSGIRNLPQSGHRQPWQAWRLLSMVTAQKLQSRAC